MEYTSKLFVEFLNKLIVFDKECRSTLEAAERVIRNRDSSEKVECEAIRGRLDSQIWTFLDVKSNILDEYHKKIATILSQDISNKRASFSRLKRCKETLALIVSVEKSITSKAEYESAGSSQSSAISMSIEEILSGTDHFISLAYEVNNAIRNGRKKDVSSKGSQLYIMCRQAEQLLNAEISNLRVLLIGNKDELHGMYGGVARVTTQKMSIEWDTALSILDTMANEFAAQRVKSLNETQRITALSLEVQHASFKKLIDGFCERFPSKQFADEYTRIYSLEPSFDHYECVKEMPRNIYKHFRI